jgi:hypothetical protein
MLRVECGDDPAVVRRHANTATAVHHLHVAFGASQPFGPMCVVGLDILVGRLSGECVNDQRPSRVIPDERHTPSSLRYSPLRLGMADVPIIIYHKSATGRRCRLLAFADGAPDEDSSNRSNTARPAASLSEIAKAPTGVGGSSDNRRRAKAGGGSRPPSRGCALAAPLASLWRDSLRLLAGLPSRSSPEVRGKPEGERRLVKGAVRLRSAARGRTCSHCFGGTPAFA